MAKKLSFLLVTVLAVFGLITACDSGGDNGGNNGGNNGGGEDKKDTEFTVTFNKNHSDKAGWTNADPKEITVESGKTIGALPDPPTRSQGWGLGTVFVEWYSNEELTMWFDEDTPITEDIIVYAKWLKLPKAETCTEPLRVRLTMTAV